MLYQLIVPGPFSCSAVDQSLLIFLFLPLLPGSHSQQTQAHSGCSSLCEEELVTGSCLLRGPDWDWLRFWAPTVQLVFPSVGGRAPHFQVVQLTGNFFFFFHCGIFCKFWYLSQFFLYCEGKKQKREHWIRFKDYLNENEIMRIFFMASFERVFVGL